MDVDNNTAGNYPEHLEETNTGVLDLSQLPIETDIADIDQYPNAAYALMRKNGLGGSDSSSILGVNPYTTRQQLIEEKCRDHLTEEEKAIGDKSAVKKGRDLEPLIMDKAAIALNTEVFKPIDMYRFKDYPWLKMNFDGMCDKVYLEDGRYQYIPCEIKVATMYGEKHYNKTKAWYYEGYGWNVVPENLTEDNNPIEIKASQVGIPPYYYTQLQAEIMAVGAPYGYLAVLFDKTWELAIYFLWADRKVQTALISESYKVWTAVQASRPANFDEMLTRHIHSASVEPPSTPEATQDAAYTSSSPAPSTDGNTEYVSQDSKVWRP